ncbi:MAG: hypothetical protein KC589_08635, partial [Nanoarchaeota archaeon]|nr:hypothetical protein [Nanoarchaeota archaeon]
MLKRVLFVALIFLSSILLINSANVEIKTYINENFTTFDYKFNFSLDESYSSFSIEKPQFSEIENINYLSESNGTIKYSAAGDFFIFRPSDNTAGKIIVLRFVSKDPTVTIGETSSFSTYLNFNFPVETLRYQLYLNESFGKILEVFPRNYELIENRYYEWEIYNISKDSLFLVNFDSKKSPIDSNNTDYSYFLVILLIAPIILFIILLIFIKNYFLKTSQKNTT